MSDLISRSIYKSKLLKALDVLNKEYREAILNEDSDLILAIQNQQSAYMLALRLLDNEPIAYSVGKIVEELESEKRYCSKYDSYYEENLYRGEMFENDVNNKTIDKAIEIVKHGGVRKESD